MSAHLQRISVIIAVRNGAATLERALTSVFEQTHPDVELIVMDGASTDGTQAIVERHAGRIAYWESKADRGVYHAWNKALDHVTGDWICFLGADDRFAAPEVLSQIAAVLAEADQDVVYARLRVVDAAGTVIRTVGDPWDPHLFRARMTLPHPATFHRRTMLERHGRFDDSYRIAGDYEMLLRELLNRDPRFISEVIAVDMATGGLSDRPSSLAVLARETHRARYSHGLERASASRSSVVWRASARGWLTRTAGPDVTEAAANLYRFVFRRPPY